MNRHDIADQEVVPAQFLAFALACALVLFGSLSPVAFNMGVDADRAFSQHKIRVWGIQVAIYGVKGQFSHRAGKVITGQVF